MRERPILMSGPLVRAILAGTKTQTRRVAKFVPLEEGFNLGFSGVSAGHYCTGVPSSGSVLYSRGAGGVWNQRTKPLFCPYGQPGDRLWCKEGLRGDGQPGDRRVGIVRYAADGEMVLPCATCGFVGCRCEGGPSARMDLLWEWKRPTLPGMFCPRWASRLTLAVESIRVERLQDISCADAIAEGIPAVANSETIDCNTPDPREAFASLWDSINAARPGCSWEANPWVWVVGFSVAEARYE